MALPTNKMSQNTQHTNQGARPTQKTENARGELRNAATGVSSATENTENKRAKTVVYS